MSGEKASTAYAGMVAEAETAVSAVKDPELRRVAFDRILATLLESKAPAAGQKRPIQPESEASHVSHRAAKGKQGPKAYVEELIDDGFFKQQKTIANVKAELANRGHHVAMTSLSGPLQSFTKQRRLRRQKITAKGNAKSSYGYSNW